MIEEDGLNALSVFLVEMEKSQDFKSYLSNDNL